jgi:replication initiation protein RepC
MAFTQVSAPVRQRGSESLSADNALPERHIVIETLRNAAPLLGLKPPVLATLDAMLSCLAPKRNHHMVFASNATLTFRRNGITDRTLRRHVEALLEAGILLRRDSPNGKRFTRHNRNEGTALRFGFDLAPLFARLAEFAALASKAIAEREELAYLRSLLRATLQRHPDHATADDARKLLRRKTTQAALTSALAALPTCDLENDTDDANETYLENSTASATNGKNVRHHHSSNKEYIDKEETSLSLTDLKQACPEAMLYAVEDVKTVQDVIRHAKTLAPMIGISTLTYQRAEDQIGELQTAATIWGILQRHSRIANPGAYFQSITTGAKRLGFDAFKFIQQLFKEQALA